MRKTHAFGVRMKYGERTLPFGDSTVKLSLSDPNKYLGVGIGESAFSFRLLSFQCIWIFASRHVTKTYNQFLRTKSVKRFRHSVRRINILRLAIYLNYTERTSNSKVL